MHIINLYCVGIYIPISKCRYSALVTWLRVLSVKKIVHCLIAIILLRLLLLDIIIIDDSILHYTFILLLYYIRKHERETTLLSGTIFLCS